MTNLNISTDEPGEPHNVGIYEVSTKQVNHCSQGLHRTVIILDNTCGPPSFSEIRTAGERTAVEHRTIQLYVLVQDNYPGSVQVACLIVTIDHQSLE